MKLRIKEICKEKGLTQKELSRMTGISEAGISNAINGNPKTETLGKIANALGVSVNELLVEEVKRPKSVYEGTLTIGNTDLPCAVLDDGTRVITQSAVFKALGRPARGNSRVTNIPTFMDAKNLQQYVNEEIEPMTKKIEFLDTKGILQTGFNCLILPIVCDIYLKARENGLLHPTQLETAQKAEVLVRSLAKVGIVALVDEATGYQYDRERNELQKILKAYISEELLAWEKRFPDEFYKEIFRLNGWGYLTVNGINKRPSIIGTWTKKYIYSVLPHGVLRALLNKSERNDKGKLKYKLHQHLTREQGIEHLNRQIISVVTLMNISDSWKEFDRLWNRKFGQQELPFKEQEELIEPKEKI